ncbi:Disintegrin and metalloproteinase domain-containing protein B, partial [Smittium mucronatum]
MHIFNLFSALIISLTLTELVVAIGKSPPISGYEFVIQPKVHTFSHKTSFSSKKSSNLLKRSLLDNNLETVRPSESFQMDLTAYNNTYRLILEPNDQLLHPKASINSIDSFGKSKTRPLSLDNIGIYRGRVIRLNSNPFASVFHAWEKDFRKRSSHEFDPEESWARISIQKHNGLSKIDGTFYIDGETFYIRPIDSYKKTKRSADPSITSISNRPENAKDSSSIIYKQSDFVSGQEPKYPLSEGTCQTMPSPGKVYRVNEHDPHYAFGGLVSNSLLKKRQNSTFSDQAALDSGCLSVKKVIYMGAAADCTYVSLYGSSEGARNQILSDWNQASAIYERQFNIALGLIYMEVVDNGCPTTPDTTRPWNRDCSTSYSLNNRLSDFSKWRGDRSDDGAGLWHLMTNCPYGSDVGLAWLGSVCQTSATNSNSAGGGFFSGTAVSSSTRDEFKVVAHEIGHNFGAIHDCNGQTCNCNGGPCDGCCPCTNACSCDAKYIMNPSSPVSSNDFSPCSVKYICKTVSSSALKCLKDVGTRPVLGVAMCGNGVLEKGEECDCGTSDDCKANPCCDWQTCKLKPGAQCLDKNSLCCKDCKIMSKNSVCRAKYSECDIEEVCDGTSAECPTDAHIKDGTKCGNSNGLTCASGICTSRDAQCSARSGSEGFNKYCKIGTFVAQQMYIPPQAPMPPPGYGYNYNNNFNQTPVMQPPNAQRPPVLNSTPRSNTNLMGDQRSNWVDPTLYNGPGHR